MPTPKLGSQNSPSYPKTAKLTTKTADRKHASLRMKRASGGMDESSIDKDSAAAICQHNTIYKNAMSHLLSRTTCQTAMLIWPNVFYLHKDISSLIHLSWLRLTLQICLKCRSDIVILTTLPKEEGGHAICQHISINTGRWTEPRKEHVVYDNFEQEATKLLMYGEAADMQLKNKKNQVAFYRMVLLTQLSTWTQRQSVSWTLPERCSSWSFSTLIPRWRVIYSYL